MNRLYWTSCLLPRQLRSFCFRWILLSTSLFWSTLVLSQQQQNPLAMNGGSVLAMSGNNCVLLAVDKRFGSGRSLVHIRHRPVLQLPRSMVAFTGMEGDVQSFHRELNSQIIDKYYRGLGFGDNTKDSRDVSVLAVAMLTSHILYRRKNTPYYVEPVVVGLEPDGWVDDDEDDNDDNVRTGATGSSYKAVVYHSKSDETIVATNRDVEEGIHGDSMRGRQCKMRRRRYRSYICGMDMIGAKSESGAFCCAGTASKSLYGTAEALWKPDLSPDQLVAIGIKAFFSALERDCLSGYGAMIYLLTPEGITEYDVIGRSD
jgi:20S proteasome alpha/beta subunit